MIKISNHEIILTADEVLLRNRIILSENLFDLGMTN
jgi:hypothetical protein